MAVKSDVILWKPECSFGQDLEVNVASGAHLFAEATFGTFVRIKLRIKILAH
jgi:hypothetical protein